MQDGASVHKATSTMSWLSTKGVRMFNEGNWPPNSPDMNPIEHVWPIVGRKLVGKVFADRDKLWDALVVAFSEVTPLQIRKLYASMPKRLQALSAASGRHTRF
jgi:transposase